MADNYLEKRMEDLRNSKTSVSTHRPRKTGNLRGMKAFVTGGASGIGRSIVENLRREECAVAFCDIDEEAGKRISSVYGARFIKLDVRDTLLFSETFDSLLSEWGDIDIVVNNVGVGDFRPLTEKGIDDFETILKTNLYPVFVTGNRLAIHRDKLLRENRPGRGGRIINICSTRHIMSEPGSEGYAASKGAIHSLTHALMMSLAPYGITVNCISPGWINCDVGTSFSASDLQQHPSGRVGRPADIADIVLFLSDPAHDFINGQDIVIDGGMTRRMIYHGDHGWSYVSPDSKGV